MQVAVVGAGPAGCLAALHASKENDVTVYEEHDLPRVQCAGLISRSGLGRLSVDPEDSVLNRVSGAWIHPPGAKPFLIDGKEDKAYVVDRAIFDQRLLEAAMDRGASLEARRVRDMKELRADLVVLSSGTDYGLQRKAQINTPKRFLVGAQYVLKAECDPSYVELHFNVPGFFSWVIPAGEYARVGCCSYRNPTPYLDSFVKKLAGEGRIKGGVAEKNYGIIPLYDPDLKTSYPGVRLVGDAAGQVKASTGGGVVMGGLAARHIMDWDYERSWKKEIGRELWMHLLIHRFLSGLSDRKKDRFLSLVSEYRDVLEKGGDMDRASSAFSMLKNPGFALKLAASLLL